ncbi:hypothetical protein KCP76_24610 [Salmonella enterica subsp. enterica serovar Weltevreden]|nr:hypothetical protein KCP76_24610 [Salmonella enterica subsp. enterica serovar Weltevreden]
MVLILPPSLYLYIFVASRLSIS